MEKGKLAFVGTGIIGAGLAVNALIAGFEATLYDIADLQITKDRIRQILDTMVEAGAFGPEKAEEALANAHYTNDLREAVEGAVFIQECVPERLELKQTTYRNIQEITGNVPVIASSTTGLMPSELQKDALYPDRILVGHPYNPSYLLPLVEIVGGSQTSDEAKAFAREMYSSWGKVPVYCNKEVYGYLCQHVNWGVRDIAMRLVREGIGTAEDVDKAIMYGPGMRFPITGQLLTLALGVEGGWANISMKYAGKPASEEELELDRQVNEELANRPEAIGNTTEEAIKFRDKMLVAMLKVQGML